MGLVEILLIFLIVLIIFGPRRLPGLGKDLGRLFRHIKSKFKNQNAK